MTLRAFGICFSSILSIDLHVPVPFQQKRPQLRFGGATLNIRVRECCRSEYGTNELIVFTEAPYLLSKEGSPLKLYPLLVFNMGLEERLLSADGARGSEPRRYEIVSLLKCPVVKAVHGR